MQATEVEPTNNESGDWALEARQLASAVRDAGALAHSMFGRPIKTWTKGPTLSPVSEADIAADNLLRERLTAQNPDIAWLSEESVDDPARLDARLVWIVDPIDGTRAYIAGLPDWAVSAALVENGRPVAGLSLCTGARRILHRARRRRRDAQRRADRGQRRYRC